MGDCNLSLSFSGTDGKEKICKYSYSSWCPTCDRNSPRRRSRSETNELCRRKCKDMKSLIPKKYSKCTEYENMELEYDYRGWHETKYECCRVRSNLVELPTSYISNNCQMPTNLSNIQKQESDLVECRKTVRAFENTLKFVEFSNQFHNCDEMQENTKAYDKVTSNRLEMMHSHHPYNKTNAFLHPKSKSPIKEKHVINDNQDSNRKGGNSVQCFKCKEYCSSLDCKYLDATDCKSLFYNTNTYFDKEIESNNLQDRYSKEVEKLREKLKMLKNSTYKNYEFSNGNINQCVDSSIKDMLITNPIDIKYKAKPERKVFSPPLVKTNKSKVSLKTRKANTCKIKKVKSKTGAAVTVTKSCYSDSESDVVDDVDDLEDEALSERSVGESSNKQISDTTVSSASTETKGSGHYWPIRASLFPHIPPYIKFNSHDSEIVCKLPAGRKYFKWKLSTITPIIVRKTLQNSGFALVRSEFSRESNQWLGTWGKHMKSPLFAGLKDTQKLNHFPGTFQLGRKDRLWRNFQKMISNFGLKEFGFIPHTYVLPHELKLLKQNWFRNGHEMWIIKPPASARGVGIKVINKWSQLPKKASLVVQKYVSNPYLINGSKFDLRLYVLVTSFHPLRIYLYPEGLARFASAKYSDDAKDLKDRYMHLTNYSINKLSSQYTENEDANACQGHKWTLSKLMEYLHKDGVDTKGLWKSLQQLVIKTIISSESLITPLCEEYSNNLYNCYELFGIDVLLDQNLKPWLLEVNISPSLHSNSPLDAHVKGPMVQTLFDMVQFHFPTRLNQIKKLTPDTFESKLYTTSVTKKEKEKHELFTQYVCREDYIKDILTNLTASDIRHLTRAEDEFIAKGKFDRIFPTAHTYKYLQFMETRYYNRLFDAWETKYASRREEGIQLLQHMCSQKLHLKVPSQSTFSKNLLNMTPGEPLNVAQARNRPLEEIMKDTFITNRLPSQTNIV